MLSFASVAVVTLRLQRLGWRVLATGVVHSVERAQGHNFLRSLSFQAKFPGRINMLNHFHSLESTAILMRSKTSNLPSRLTLLLQRVRPFVDSGPFAIAQTPVYSTFHLSLQRRINLTTLLAESEQPPIDNRCSKTFVAGKAR